MFVTSATNNVTYPVRHTILPVAVSFISTTSSIHVARIISTSSYQNCVDSSERSTIQRLKIPQTYPACVSKSYLGFSFPASINKTFDEPETRKPPREIKIAGDSSHEQIPGTRS